MAHRQDMANRRAAGGQQAPIDPGDRDGTAVSPVRDYGVADLEGMAHVHAYYEWIVRAFGPYLHGRVLEVGAGIGNFAVHYASTVEEAVLWEPDVALSRRLAARFDGKPQLRTIAGPLGDLSPDNGFDALVAVNVMEHISNDALAIELWSRFLRPGGALLLFVPALPLLFGSLDEAVQHKRRYTPAMLRRLLSATNLRVVKLNYFDVAGLIPWLVAGRILRLRTLGGSPAQIYDRFVVPVSERFERRFTPPIGKNLLCVAVRPTTS